MKKVLFAALLPALFLSTSVVPQSSIGILREGEPGADGSNPGEPEPEVSKGRKILMDDGRELTFTEKGKIQKSYGVKEGNVFALIDFDNSKSVEVLLPAGSLVEIAAQTVEGGAPTTDAKLAKVALDAMGHGMVQKLGDAAAGAESTDDAFEAILEVAKRLSAGEWSKTREGSSGGSAKGASELVQALEKYLGVSKEVVRDKLAKLTAGDKAALRRVPEVATIIEQLRAAKSPSKKEAERLAEATALLAGMKSDAPVETAPAE